MSHVTTIDSDEVYDLVSIIEMCKNERWAFLKNQANYAWYGRHVGDYPLPAGFTVQDMGTCTHAIRVPGASYEIGVVFKSGQWRLIYDFYSAGGLDSKLGQNAGLLKQAYGMAKAQVTCKQQNKSWTQQPVRNREGWKKMVVNMSRF
jgi:hypothetical protein